MENYDLIVIGAGPGGYELAAHASRQGERVAIVERNLLGGTCLNAGCIPTKALLKSAEMVSTLRNAADFGIDIQDISLQYDVAAERKDRVVSTLRQGVADVLAGVDVIDGEASFIDPHVIAVGERRLSAPRIVIATGSRPATPPIAGIGSAMTSDDFLAMTELSERVVIIGGGVIGIEFALIFNAFGSKVTVVEYCKEILPPFDSEIAKKLRQTLSKKYIDIVVDAQVTEITSTTVTYTRKGKEVTVDCDAVLAATGRQPVIPDGAVEAGIKVGRRGIEVDDRMMTSVDGVYAIGDVNGRCMLAHAASAQGRVVLGEEVNLDVIPSAVFSTPEVAMVGLTEDTLKAEGKSYKAGKATFRFNGKSLAMGENDGMVKVLVDSETGKILGAHILGPHANDLIQGIAYAMNAGISYLKLRDTIHGHPTLSEAVQLALSNIR